MTIGDIANDITQVFGIPKFSIAPDFIQARVMIDINSAIEQLQNSGEDYYSREDLDIALVADDDDYTLGNDVQSVLDPVRLDDGTLLRKLTSRGQILQWGQFFNDQLDNSQVSGLPSAFYIESVRNPAFPQGVMVILHFVPPPSPPVVAIPLGLIVPTRS